MIKHTFIRGLGRRSCDTCGNVRVPDSLITFIDDDTEEIYATLTCCFTCSQKLLKDLNIDTERKSKGFNIEF